MIPFLSSAVRDVMTTEVVSVRRATPLRQLRDIFYESAYNAVPVAAEDNAIEGWITQFDFLRAFMLTPKSKIPAYEEILALTAAEIMTTDVKLIDPELPLGRLLSEMLETRHRSFPVVEQGKVVGIVARRDILNGLRHSGL